MINIEIPKMTIGDLAKHIESGIEPVRISSHVGNQMPHELVTMAGLPPGVDVMMVDTIQGNDRTGAPNLIKRSTEHRQLMSRTQASGRVVGSLRAIDPADGFEKTLEQIHTQVVEQLPLTNTPITMMKFFGKYPDLLRATVAACLETGDIRRVVEDGGKIKPADNSALESQAIYGLDGTTGILLPLNGMMAIDMLISTHLGSDSTLHMGGGDMTVYTRDTERMTRVDETFMRASALLAIKNTPHTYRVIDSRGLGVVITEQSQHELLQTGTIVDISEHLGSPTGVQS